MVLGDSLFRNLWLFCSVIFVVLSFGTVIEFKFIQIPSIMRKSIIYNSFVSSSGYIVEAEHRGIYLYIQQFYIFRSGVRGRNDSFCIGYLCRNIIHQ